MLRQAVAASLLISAAVPALAQTPAGNSKPQPVPLPPAMPTPQDVAYPGTLTLDIDATNARQGIFSARETIPVAHAGDTVLLYPQWLPGAHAPQGELDKLAGLHFFVGGQELPWTRDPVDMYAMHISVPTGAKTIEARFDFLSATRDDQGPVMASPDLLRLEWISMSLYPAGYFTRDIAISATAHYPAGFTAASGLPSTRSGTTYRYQTTSYEILMDSPVVAGRYYKSWTLSPQVTLDAVADRPEELAATPDQIDRHKALVDQAVKLFGAQHYDNYHFLFSISDQINGIGLEHHRSSEDGDKPGYFIDWDNNIGARNLLPHEYSHSWDGKFRRGADLWTPNYDVPMRPQYLWVYEGGTQFFGYLLQARSGLVSKEDTLDQYAGIIANLDHEPGRAWRSLVDTTYDETIAGRRPKPWVSEQRTEDYYNEGLLIWMEVDSLLRQKSGGTKSIDDFARTFFGMRDGDYGELTYTIDDVAAALNSVVPSDWKAFLVQRTTEHAQHAPMSGFERNGYRLVYTDEPSKVAKQTAKTRGNDYSYSLGLNVDKEGKLNSVLWDGPAFQAGLTAGTELVAVGGTAYSDDILKAAVTAAKTEKTPILLTVKRGSTVSTVAIDYHGGLRYPHLEKIGTGEAGLDRLLAPK